jgi:hypothetical protein
MLAMSVKPSSAASRFSPATTGQDELRGRLCRQLVGTLSPSLFERRRRPCASDERAPAEFNFQPCDVSVSVRGSRDRRNKRGPISSVKRGAIRRAADRGEAKFAP